MERIAATTAASGPLVDLADLADLAGWVGIECRRLDNLTGRRLAKQYFGQRPGRMTTALREMRSSSCVAQADRDGVVALARHIGQVSGHDKARYVQQQIERL